MSKPWKKNHWPFDLSPKEQRVLDLTQMGMFCSEIAVEMNISPKTVQTHYYKIHQKLGFAKKASILQGLARKAHGLGEEFETKPSEVV